MDSSVSTLHNFSSRNILDFLRSQTGLEGVALFKIDDEEFLTQFVSGQIPGLTEGHCFNWKNTVFEDSMTGKIPSMVPDTSYLNIKSGSSPFHIEPASFFAFPVTQSSSDLYGYLIGYSSKEQSSNFFNHQASARFCASQIALSTEYAEKSSDHLQLVESLTELAYTDALTGLLNRTGWESAITEKATNSFGGQAFCSAFVIDIDDLKFMNDTQGHAFGDEAIRSTAEKLKEVFGENLTETDDQNKKGLVARTGGDEFSALLFGCDDSDAEEIAIQISDHLLQDGFSVSVGYACCRTTSKLPTALMNADEAMYKNKAARKKARKNISIFRSTG